MSDATEVTERKQYAYFTRFDEYNDLLKHLFTYDLSDPSNRQPSYDTYRRITTILDHYQEQSYLLDPYLERMVSPVIQRFRARAVEAVAGRAREEWHPLISMLLHHLLKTRGTKVVLRFFPHETSDLEIALQYLQTDDIQGPKKHMGVWEPRYITLLWLSLIVMLPFDLAKFDKGTSGETTKSLEDAGKECIAKAGLEREGAALLLARLYARSDCRDGLSSFLDWGTQKLRETEDGILALGCLSTVCILSKTGYVGPYLGRIREFWDLVGSNSKFTTLTLVRKFHSKLSSRIAISELPARTAVILRKRLTGENTVVEPAPVDIDVPELVEEMIEDLLSALQDRDTIVRWSAAKGLARIAERLPADLCHQILDSIIALFSIHVLDDSGGIQELPASAEGTWHGAALATAEMANHGLVKSESLGEVLSWVKRGLYFDIRKGAHSIGSNVRDASAYVLWSLARAHDKESFRPYALDVARRLVAVSLFDREVHVRRAATAAFQEHVGRMGLFPHGIDVISNADFYAVSVRRTAFTVCAPQVARNVEYRDYLFQHLLTITLRHWDPSMREAGAVTLSKICELDLKALGPISATKAANLLTSIDSQDVHGGLLTLSELAASYKASGDASLEQYRLQVFKYVVESPKTAFARYRNELILEAICDLFANSLSVTALQLNEGIKAPWKDLLDLGTKNNKEEVQKAAARAWRTYSEVADCSKDVERYVYVFPASPIVQQSISRLLGTLAYRKLPDLAVKSIVSLLQFADNTTKVFTANVEARRNAFDSLSRILQGLDSHLSSVVTPQLLRQVYASFLRGLSDYSTDQRGDVGSWIRMSCIQGLTDTSLLCFKQALSLTPLEDWIPPSSYREFISGTLKQAVERLDNVRQVAVTQLIRVIESPLPSVDAKERWELDGRSLLHHELIETADEMKNWGDGSWLFSKAIRLLGVPAYHNDMLLGFVLSVGSRNEGATQPACNSLVNYALALPLADQKILVDDIVQIGRNNFTSNHVYLPVLQTLDVLLAGGLLGKLAETEATLECVRNVLASATRNIQKAKSVERVMVSAKIVSGLLGISTLTQETAEYLPLFLGHQYPKVRSSMAEELYLSLQGMETEVEEVEELLLGTTWTAPESELQDTIGAIVSKLKEADRSS